MNEYAAENARERPDRLGFFATLPPPYVDETLIESAHALDDLRADGVVLLANNRGTCLGDPSSDPLMDELNRRRAVVFVHPAEPPGPATEGVPPFAAASLMAVRVPPSGGHRRQRAGRRY